MAGRKVILLLDGAKVHFYSNLNLRNTTVHTLPPYTTSRLQPMDAGIIMSFKNRYRSYFIKWLLDQYELGKDNKMDVLTAIKYIVRAWREVSPNTVYNCFRHTKILLVVRNEELVTDDNEELFTNNNEEFVADDNDKLIEELHEDIEALHLRNVMDLDNYLNYPGENDTNEVLDDQEIVDLVTSVESEINNSDYEEDDD
ncbi:15260_t:CDS:1, partial [Gigaspora margarita]